MQVQTFTLSLRPDDYPTNVPQVYANQYDAGRAFAATILDLDGNPYTPNGETATICGTKPDGTGFSYDATLSGSVVSFSTTGQMTAVGGHVRCGIILTRGAVTVGTLAFDLYVQPAALQTGTIISSDDFGSIISDAVVAWMDEHGIPIDDTLTRAGAAADAAATGDRIDQVEADTANGLLILSRVAGRVYPASGSGITITRSDTSLAVTIPSSLYLVRATTGGEYIHTITAAATSYTVPSGSILALMTDTDAISVISAADMLSNQAEAVMLMWNNGGSPVGQWAIYAELGDLKSALNNKFTLPSGGVAGQALVSDGDGGAIWGEASGGGDAETVLTISNNAYTGIENNEKVYGLSDFESGKYINLNGEVIERANLYTTGFIPFHKGIASIITNLGTWANMYEISFWDIGQNFISGISLPTTNVDYEVDLANVPQTTAFVRFCTFQGQKNTIAITQFSKIRDVYDSIADLGIGALITHNDVGYSYIDNGSGSLKQVGGGENTGLVDISSYQKIYVSKSLSGRGISYGYFVADDGLTILYTIPDSDPLRKHPSAYRVELTVPQNAKYVILSGTVDVVESIKIEVDVTEKATDLVFKLRELNAALLAVLAEVVYTTNAAQTEYAALQAAMERI